MTLAVSKPQLRWGMGNESISDLKTALQYANNMFDCQETQTQKQ